jgi:hypothetical protein
MVLSTGIILPIGGQRDVQAEPCWWCNGRGVLMANLTRCAAIQQTGIV